MTTEEFADTIAVQRKPMDYIPKGYRACTADACAQGDKPCPVPDACRTAVDADTSRDMLGGLLLALGIVAVIALLVALAVRS